MKEYVVLELCLSADGSLAPSIYSYVSIDDARALFYNKCAVAVKSAYLVHTVMLMTVSGGMLEQPKVFRHEPEAEPEGEPENEGE